MKNFEIINKLKELQAEMALHKEEEDLLHVQLKNRIAEARDLRERRDSLNEKVKELSGKPKEILQDRKEIWDTIKVTGEEKRKALKEIQPYLRRIGEIRKVRDTYNYASRGSMDRLSESYETTLEQLMKGDMNLKNELFLFEMLFRLRDRIYVKRKADMLHREIVRIKEEDLAKYNKIMEELDIRIDGMKERSHSDLETARDIWSERDQVRSQAQKLHKDYLEKNREIRDIKKSTDAKKRTKHDLYRTMDEWRSELKKTPEERRQLDKGRRLQEALAKYRKGESLSLEEMGMLLEAGELK